MSCILSNIHHLYCVQLFLNWQQLMFVPVFDAVATLINSVKRPNCTHITNSKWNKKYTHSAHILLQITDSSHNKVHSIHASSHCTLHKFHKVVSHCVKCTCANLWQCRRLSFPDMCFHRLTQSCSSLTWDHWWQWSWRLINREHYFISVQW